MDTIPETTMFNPTLVHQDAHLCDVVPCPPCVSTLRWRVVRMSWGSRATFAREALNQFRAIGHQDPWLFDRSAGLSAAGGYQTKCASVKKWQRRARILS